LNLKTNLYLSDDVRKQNRLRVLSQFRKVGQVSRTELGKQTELSPGTVTNVTTGLLSENVIQAADNDVNSTQSHGRPRVQLGLNPNYGCVIAGALNFNGLKLDVIDYSGRKIVRIDEPIKFGKSDAKNLGKKIYSLVEGLALARKPDIYVIGVQGLTSNDGQDILWSPILDDAGNGFASILSELSNAKVIVANDCAMIAQSLSKASNEEHPSFAAVLMSYGIGIGLYIDGQPFHGIRSSASELGHISYRREDGALCRCGKHGCVEAYASDYAIWRMANEKGSSFLPEFEIKASDISDIVAKARLDDGPERRAIKQAGRALGYGLATMFSFFDPFPVTFVGRGAQALDLMEDDIRHSLSENFRFQKDINVPFSQDLDAQQHIENGCAIVALELMDQSAAFEVIKV
jgi:predicted NBD/HSP70 family sugar kinase